MIKLNQNSEPLPRRGSLFSFLPQARSASVGMGGRRKPPSTNLYVQPRKDGGFTLIELIMVLVLMGVLAVFAAPRTLDTGGFYARGFHDQTMAYLRYAQKTAIAQRRTVCVTFTASTIGLSIASAAGTNACSTPLLGPSGTGGATREAELASKSGVAFNGIPTAFNFDGLGQPISTAGSVMGLQSIQVVGVTSSIKIEAATGYVHE